MSRAKVTACIIAKNEEKSIERCLASIRPFVEEICIVDTGSSDRTVEIAKKYADIIEIFTLCNDKDGDILDFSMARNRSFELASNDIVMWLDADDIVVGLENLNQYIEKYQNTEHPHFIQAPYEYCYDDKGNCSLVHYRERIFFKKNCFNWCNPVHEVCMAKPNFSASSDTVDDIVWKHQRQYIGKNVKPNRNLRILQKWIEQNGEEKDARQLYYIGLEYGNSGDVDRSRYYLEKYISKSGWDDEIYMAILRLIIYSMAEGKYDDVVDYALRAIKIKPEWGEAYFEAAKAYYSMANEGKDEYSNWNKCVHFAKIGLSLPPTKTVLFVNPIERDLIIHKYLNFALNKLGKIEEAYDSANQGLKADPDDAALRGNIDIYARELSKRELFNALGKFKEKSGISEAQEVAISRIINGENVDISWKPYNRKNDYPVSVTEEDFPVPVKTPHSQAWGIPESFVYDDLPLMMTTAQLKALTVAVWKEYMLHDELMSAISFLENAPTRVRHHAEIEDILSKTKGMTEWIKNDEEYSKFNAPLDENDEPFTTEMAPLEYALTSEAQTRLNLLKDRTEGGDKTIIDWGCNDGFITNRLALARKHKQVIGIDGCHYSVDVGNTAAKKHNTGVEYIFSFFTEVGDKLSKYGENGKFDYAVSGDVIEHLKDPVNDLLIPMKNHLKDDGKLVLTCPHQALFQGKFVSWADPWKIAKTKGKNWLQTPRRNHIIAPTVWSIKDKLEQAGFYVSSCFRFPFPEPFVEGHSQLVAEALKKFPDGHDKGKDIVFYLGYNVMPEITPNKMDLDPVGGSEIALRQMSERLAARGHRVRVYADCGYDGEGVYNGVSWLHITKWRNISADVIIVSRQAGALEKEFNNKAKLNAIVAHDLVPYNMTPEIAENTDVIFALSNWHKDFMIKSIPYLNPDKIVVTGNGIDLSLFENKDIKRKSHQILCSSSPDRYLPLFLDCWDRIQKMVPDANAIVSYSFDNWRKPAQFRNDQAQLKEIDDLEARLISFKDKGIEYVGRLRQEQLAQKFLESGVWALPSWFEETNCIGLSECLASGATPVVSNRAALGERLPDNLGYKIDGDWRSKEYQDLFVEKMVKALLNTTETQRHDRMQYAKDNFGWDKFVDQWIDALNIRN